MTRKHFQAIADSLRDAKPPHMGDPAVYKVKLEQWGRTCERMADTMRGFNPNFDRERFLSACGYYDD